MIAQIWGCQKIRLNFMFGIWVVCFVHLIQKR